MNMLKKLFLKRVIKVRVEGDITQKMTNNIVQGFRGARFYSPEAVVVVVNSIGGSLVQAKQISDIITNYSFRNQIPIYCVAQDHCFGSANVLLTMGTKTYVHQMTLLGDFSFFWSSLWFKKFSDKYNVRIQFLYSGQNKVKFNPFQKIKPQSQKWMQNYLYALEHDLKCAIINHRSKNFTKNLLDKASIQDKVFKGPIISPEQAVKVGLVDQIGTVDQLLNKSFNSVKVYEINKRSKYGKFKSGMQIFA